MSKTKLFPYQKEGVKRLLHFKGRALLADEMGLGKTLQTLIYKKRAGLTRCVVVCPAAVKYSWEREIALHLNERCEIVEGRKSPKRNPFNSKTKFIIINYEILEGWLDHLITYHPELVVVDECHRIQNRSTKSYKNTYDLCYGKRKKTKPKTEKKGSKSKSIKRNKVHHVIGLSGTPLTNRPAELWSMLNILRPDLFRAFFPYGERYCQPKRRFGKWEYKGATRLKQLNRILTANVMIRRTKDEVKTQLPPVRTIPIPLALSIKHQKDYGKAEANFIAWMRLNFNTGSKRQAAHMVKTGALLRLASVSKLKQVINWIDGFLESEQKLIVFGIHKKVLKPLRDHYKHSSVLINGTVTGRKRQQAIDNFCNDKNMRLCIANMQAAGTGINGLQKVCSNVLFVELPWIPSDVSQAIARVHRLGQTNNVNIYFAMAKGTVEERQCHLLTRKQSIFDQVMDGKGSGEVSIFNELLEEMLEG